MNVVLIHGRGQAGKNPEQLRADWIAGIEQGFSAAGRAPTKSYQILYPFYGDKLQDLINQLPTKEQERNLSRGEAPEEEPDPLVKDVVVCLAERAGVDLDEADPEDEALMRGGPETWGWVRGLLRTVEKKLPWVAEAAIGEQLEDVKFYMGNRFIQEEVDEIVLEDLRKKNAVAIAHSLGTVVAYNILWRHPEIEVPLFVTAGSPLGIRVIRNKLPIPPRIPAKRWLNISDPEDIVALYPSLDKSSFVDGIENLDDIENGDNPHSIVRYLSDKRVGSILADALSS